jgi:hypothetical protein
MYRMQQPYYLDKKRTPYRHLQMIVAQHGIMDLESRLVKNKKKRHDLIKLFANKDRQLMILADRA